MAADWIKGAIKRPGALKAKAKKAGMGTMAFARKNAGKKGLLGKQSRLAETLAGFRMKGKFKKAS